MIEILVKEIEEGVFYVQKNGENSIIINVGKELEIWKNVRNITDICMIL
jgi:hypothetical protein